MRLFYLFLLTFSSLYVFPAEKTVYYVSSTTGSDKNAGTIDAPKRTIGDIIKRKKENLDLRLCRGDIFYESISGLKNSVISAYGKGAKPILCGFKVLRDINQWTYNASRDYWMLDLMKTSSFAGFYINPKDTLAAWNDIGCIYVPAADTIIGHIVKNESLIKNNGDFFVDTTYQKPYLNRNSFRYLRYKGENPKKLGNICLSIRSHGISNMHDCEIREIAIMGFGMHGICGLYNSNIINCRLDVIGGSVQIGYNNWVRFGNGIEFGASAYDNTVEGCFITRTYDCGSTIQGTGNIAISPHNITFKNNIFYHCRQAFEHFLNANDTILNYVNCHFVNNTCIDNGYNDFDSPELRDAQILSYERVVKKIDVSHNIFYGGNYFCGIMKPCGMRDNVVYIYKEQYLNHYHGKKNYPTIFADCEKSIKKYKEWSCDYSDIIIVERGSKKDLKLRHKIERKIGFKKLELHLERILNE